MALFNRTTKTKKSPAKSKTSGKQTAPSTVRDLAFVLSAPRITEKAMRGSEKNVYVFEISRDADKRAVKEAVNRLFGVLPVKVNIVNRAPRQYKARARGRMALEHGMKKAYVYLKEGDSISLV